MPFPGLGLMIALRCTLKQMVDYIWKGREEATKCLARPLVTAVQGRAVPTLVNVLCILFRLLRI